MSDLAYKYAVTGGVWHPRFQVFLGPGIQDITATPDLELTPTLSVLTQKNNFYAADRFHITASLWLDPAFGYDFWAQIYTLSVLVKIGFPDENVPMTEVFRGFADKIIIDPVKGIVTITGRNALGLLIDKQVFLSYGDTGIGEQIDQAYAQAGLHPPVYEEGFPSGQVTGRYVHDKHTTNTQGQQSTVGAWDLCMSYTQQVGGNVWEHEGVCHYDMGKGGKYYTVMAPQGENAFANSTGQNITGQVTKLSPINVTYLTIEHDLEFSQWTHNVTVFSQQPTGKTHKGSFPGEVDTTDPYLKPHYIATYNYSPQDTNQLAESQYNEFMLHEYVVCWKVAGPYIVQSPDGGPEPMLPRDKFNLIGTNDFFDGPYQVMQIEHRLDFRNGYTGSVRGQWGRTANAINAPDAVQPGGG